MLILAFIAAPMVLFVGYHLRQIIKRKEFGNFLLCAAIGISTPVTINHVKTIIETNKKIKDCKPKCAPLSVDVNRTTEKYCVCRNKTY